MKINKSKMADVKYLLSCVGKGKTGRLPLQGVYIADERTIEVIKHILSYWWEGYLL